jgi:hypothetical protein
MSASSPTPGTRSIRAVTVVLLAGVAMQLAFVGSYVGAFHTPTLHKVPVELVAPSQIANTLAARLDGLPGAPLQIHRASSLTAARTAILSRQAYAYFAPGQTTDTVGVATAANKATAAALTTLFTRVDAAQHRPAPQVVDLAPLPVSDAGGTSGFYAVVAWMIGGYLGATLLGLLSAPRASSRRRALDRITALAAYAVVSGLLSSILLSTVIGVLGGHFLALWAIATLAVFAVGASTAALQAVLGVAGTGIAILLFVVLGNPSSGGAYARVLLPGFWRAIGALLPPGAAVDIVRNTVYFQGNATIKPILVLIVWAAIGTGIALLLGGRSTSTATIEAEATAGIAAA